MSFLLPPITKNKDGNLRKVGLEIEFAGIEPMQAAEIIASVFGGEIAEEHRYHINITDTDLGDFRVELDARVLRRMAEENIFDKLGISLEEDSIRKSIEDVVDKMARSVVPLEIVMPPVTIQELDQLERLREALQQNKAKGTYASMVHAFGMHLNIESPDLKLTTLLDYLRAFMIVYPWLLKALDIDMTRRISPFVDPFPDKYVKKILNPDYVPDVDQFIEDYIEFNPTRNRPVDMMPIFGMLNEKLIAPVMEGEKNDPRPTYHYRLPNSRIDDPEWRFADEWNHWLVVEKLVSNNEMLEKLSRLYLLRRDETVISFRKEWANTLEILLDLDEQA
ncbi:amidoligase family protein [Fodinibius sp.]|uniref:amidoligase family protein n=1 Tax=Fodinibius sp. TaxID=1872440 RepID=UPI002ACE6D68|nr:amidoligase family protein [Fodinibius sp.]MDZ7659315.1 amidoligase family protein [Fodinibius sp.]